MFHDNIYNKIIAELKVDKKMIFDYITTEEKYTECMIYIDGPGDIGKTFLYKVIIHDFFGIGK